MDVDVNKMDGLSELIKEVYAIFGLAYYESEVLHRGLCNFYALATFDKPESVTRPRIEEKLAYAYSLTLGRLISVSKQSLPDDIQDKLDLALEKRNFLAHYFWFEKNYLMFSKEGLLQLLDELSEYVDFFDNLDRSILNHSRPMLADFGISDELLYQIYEKILLGEPDEPLISQRALKKQECIVRVWDVEVSDGLVTQVFETEDGELWQLSDVGLGWSILTKSENNWEENSRISKHLPARINPRPPIRSPWNYEFQLADDVLFWVKRSKKEKSYHWGLKVFNN